MTVVGEIIIMTIKRFNTIKTSGAVLKPLHLINSHQTNKMKLYKYKDLESERYYTNLTTLCKDESLNYFKLYHSIRRKKNGIWNNKQETQSVELLYTSPSKN